MAAAATVPEATATQAKDKGEESEAMATASTVPKATATEATDTPDEREAMAAAAAVPEATVAAEANDKAAESEAATAKRRAKRSYTDEDKSSALRRHKELVAIAKDWRITQEDICLLYTSPSPRDRTRSRMPSSA